MAQIRQPAVAGQFYPSAAEELRAQIESFSDKREAVKQAARACLLPHAGYMYSGAVAYSIVSQIEIKPVAIVIGPNHTGRGVPFSIMDEGSWVSPFGSIAIHATLAKKLLQKKTLLQPDYLAQQFEHSVEVELPLLQYFRSDFSFVPIVVGSDNFKACEQVGLKIATSIQELGLEKDTLIIASSDMTHYEDAHSAKTKDSQAIRAILELDAAALWEKVHDMDITMCGYAPATVMITAAKALGATRGELIKYQTSGDVTGDNSSVVGYAGIIVK